MTNPTTIARSLSEAQRAAVLAMDPSDPPVISRPVEEMMLADGLIGYEAEQEFYLNELGLAVRAAILAEQEGGA